MPKLRSALLHLERRRDTRMLFVCVKKKKDKTLSSEVSFLSSSLRRGSLPDSERKKTAEVQNLVLETKGRG